MRVGEEGNWFKIESVSCPKIGEQPIYSRGTYQIAYKNHRRNQHQDGLGHLIQLIIDGHTGLEFLEANGLMPTDRPFLKTKDTSIYNRSGKSCDQSIDSSKKALLALFGASKSTTRVRLAFDSNYFLHVRQCQIFQEFQLYVFPIVIVR